MVWVVYMDMVSDEGQGCVKGERECVKEDFNGRESLTPGKYLTEKSLPVL